MSRYTFDPSDFTRTQIAQAEADDVNRKSSLPGARVKRIVKSEPEIPMVAGEVTIILSKACEVFVAELAQRAYAEAQKDGRRTIGRPDVVRGCSQSNALDFLIDILGEEAIAIKRDQLQQQQQHSSDTQTSTRQSVSVNNVANTSNGIINL